MQAYTRPLLWWTGALVLAVAIIAGHQYWIANQLRASIATGDLGDPGHTLPGFRFFAYLLEGILFLVSSAGFLQATVKFLHAVHRRRRYSRTERVLMPGRCS